MNPDHSGLSADGRHLGVSDARYTDLVERLALQVHESCWEFDWLLCLARGGLRPGDVLSRLFGKPLAILSVSSYRAASGTLQGQLDIARCISTAHGDLAGRVLLVDDLVDTGHTFRTVIGRLQIHCPAITELRSAVLWQKARSAFAPDYVVEQLPTSPWIHQPFEHYDTIGIDALKAQVALRHNTR
jgi:hypoxanthine phosphoribosyltransferase